MPLHHLHTNVHRESPHLFQNRLCQAGYASHQGGGVFSLLQSNALISPKPQTYIEKDPIGPSKQLRAPRKRSSVSAFSLL